MKAYQRLCEIARKWKPGDPPVFGAFEGLVKITENLILVSEDTVFTQYSVQLLQ